MPEAVQIMQKRLSAGRGDVGVRLALQDPTTRIPREASLRVNTKRLKPSTSGAP